ncbi:MAG: DNA primase [Proteobacteria bacterium]|nr:DNA primase [Pseudomonadota bacterium]
MSFTPDFLDEIRARTPLADIIGRRVNLIRRGREHVALCPFHTEKTPSFTVNEDKGFFHCLAAETGVIVRDGVRPIASLAGGSAEILSPGGKWVRAEFKAYGIQKLYRIDLSRNGVTKSVFATSGHRWFVRGAKRSFLTTELRPGHRLNTVAPTRRSDWSLEPAGVRHGIVFGDGSLGKGRYGHVHLHGEKDADLARWFPEQEPQRKLRENGKPYLRIYGGRAFEHMKSLPSLEESDNYLLGFMAGYLAADGHVAKDGTVMLHSAKRANLQWVRAAATRLGVGTYGITTAVRRGLGTVDAKISRIHFVASSLDPALILGEVARQRFESADKAFARLRWSVVAVEETDREEEVYCAEVPEEHAFALEDNILTGNCFGCGAHGDAIGFEMRIDNLTFPEAVERLARAAGLALPARTPEERERTKERTSLYAVLEAACVWFEAQLAGAGGKTAREYLAARGVDDATIATFRLGWAPDSRTALKEALARQDISGQMMVTGGLLKQPEGGGAAYDRFRGRIIFPITDRGGRVVGFGGRALGDREPKYLNSPETPLFHKRQLLYGAALARKAAREASEVIVAEGYMDVIALHRAGFANAVAPLGTALTEEQIQELWRLAPEPVVCFDGDSAGHRAACRVAERALPLLEPGRSLRFVALPAGEDPDSLIAKRGAQALREALAQARPLADLLWEIETRDRPIDTPERRAGVKKRLEKVAGRIGVTLQ